MYFKKRYFYILSHYTEVRFRKVYSFDIRRYVRGAIHHMKSLMIADKTKNMDRINNCLLPFENFITYQFE